MSTIGTVNAQLRRRILVSYALDAAVAARLLPNPFRPHLVSGRAVGGFCMIGMRSVRPGWIAPAIGLRTENAAHRMGIEWDENGQTRTGVYIFERHSSSLLPILAGGRYFPGVQKHARFELRETETRFHVEMRAPDAYALADVELSNAWSSSLFGTVDAVSDFYRQGAIGWSPRRNGEGAEPLRLTSQTWSIEPARIREIRSSFFDSFPGGSAELDNAVIMRNQPLVWDVPPAAHRRGNVRRPIGA